MCVIFQRTISLNLKIEASKRSPKKMEIKRVILFFIFGQIVRATDKKVNKDGVLTVFENKFVYKMGDVTNYVTKMLEEFNDRHLGSSEWGKVLGYDELKPKLLDDNSRKGRGIKKMSMALMPLIFHVGATSTWMLITSIMAAKSVAIGLLLLVFKIAVSSAKVASFFTLLKSKHAEHDHHHDLWAWPAPHHGHDRSLAREPPHEEWSSYSPEWSPTDAVSPPAYKTIPMYKENAISSNYEDIEYEDSKPPKGDRKHS